MQKKWIFLTLAIAIAASTYLEFMVGVEGLIWVSGALLISAVVLCLKPDN